MANHTPIVAAALPELPETHDWLCLCCNTVRTTVVCPDSGEIVGVYAWERGCPPVWARGSWYEGHSPELTALERQTQKFCDDQFVLVERLSPTSVLA